MDCDFDPEVFAREWAEAWSRGDLDFVLSHYADDVTLLSPRAKSVTGEGLIQGKEALRAYWARALNELGPVTFEVLDVAWDEQRAELTVRYRSRRGSRVQRAIELFEFDQYGAVRRGEAFSGLAEVLPDE